ncbi:MAG: tetratricopeptide repeat protein, partial [Victivallales bacterium]|nr:tetratricopeptide repeat protein [Victivallales bacterium]
MTVIEEYEAAASAGKWLEALQLAQQIAERAPHPTCWFNVGVCLDELNRHMEAAQAFQRVIAGDYFDDGARFRMLRSLFLTGDSGVQIVHDEIATIVRALPQVVVELSQLETFTSLFKQDEFAVLKTAAERNLETRRTSLQHLSGEGFVFSEP